MPEANPEKVADRGTHAAVVASQGHYDEEALETILKSGAASYVGLVASRKRGAVMRDALERGGIADTGMVRMPAGLDLGARSAPEVALSILAEIVQSQSSVVAEPDELPATTTAIDPVCGMEVVISSAKHVAEVDGTRYYFCCPHCRAQFLADPHAYLAAPS